MKSRLGAAVLCAALAGCAAPWALQPGATRDEVVARMGRPTGVVKLPQGERLQYSTQPAGQQAWMADLDGAGRLTSIRQVLTADDFKRIEPGQWSRADVEREFGRPAWIDRTANWDGTIMTYRWHDDITDKFFWVYLDGSQQVRRAHAGTEYRISLPPSDALP